MIPLAYITLIAWIVLGPALMATQPKRRAVLIIFIAGFLFLPEMPEFPVHSGTPPVMGIRELCIFITKPNAMSYGFLIGLVLFDQKRLLAFRPRWFDVPMLLWGICPFFSAMTNGDPVGKIDGIRPIPGVIQAVQQSMMWFVPYLAGRLYIRTLDDLHALAHGLLLGGIAYAPLCLTEKVLSPQLHFWIYGYHAHDFSQAIRSGYRPTVFLEHGLMVAMWMVASALLAVWMWWTYAFPSLPWLRGQKPLPMGLVVLALLVATLMMNSSGALALGLMGAAVLFPSRVLPMRVVLAGLVAVAPLYAIGRIPVGFEPTGWLNSSLDDLQSQVLERKSMRKPMFVYSSTTMEEVEDFMAGIFNKERAGSMLYRFKQEDKLLEKVAYRPWFGWGGEGRGRIFEPRKGRDVSIVDGLWILTLSDRGFVGLTLLCAAILLPVVRFVYYYPSSQWTHPGLAPAAVLALVLALWMVDNLSNAMVDPLFIFSAGALGSVTGIHVSTWGKPANASATPPADVGRPFALPRGKTPAGAETKRPGVLSRRRAGKIDSETESR